MFSASDMNDNFISSKYCWWKFVSLSNVSSFMKTIVKQALMVKQIKRKKIISLVTFEIMWTKYRVFEYILRADIVPLFRIKMVLMDDRCLKPIAAVNKNNIPMRYTH